MTANNVVDLAQQRVKKEPHVIGIVFCMNPVCRHQWQSVKPLDMRDSCDMECPQCHAMRGVWGVNFGIPNGPDGMHKEYVCLCGSSVFKVSVAAVHCIGCGRAHTFQTLAEVAQ